MSLESMEITVEISLNFKSGNEAIRNKHVIHPLLRTLLLQSQGCEMEGSDYIFESRILTTVRSITKHYAVIDFGLSPNQISRNDIRPMQL